MIGGRLRLDVRRASDGRRERLDAVTFDDGAATSVSCGWNRAGVGSLDSDSAAAGSTAFGDPGVAPPSRLESAPPTFTSFGSKRGAPDPHRGETGVWFLHRAPVVDPEGRAVLDLEGGPRRLAEGITEDLDGYLPDDELDPAFGRHGSRSDFAAGQKCDAIAVDAKSRPLIGDERAERASNVRRLSSDGERDRNFGASRID